MVASRGSAYPVAKGSDCGTGYGWKSSPAMSGAVRWVLAANARNHEPRAPRNLTGEVDELLGALGASLPRGERPTPQTKFELETALRASYAATSARPHTAADWFALRAFHCGLTKSGWLHSFMTMNWCTVGKVCATIAVQAANCWILVVSPHERGSVDAGHRFPSVSACEWSGYRSSSTVTPAVAAGAITRWVLFCTCASVEAGCGPVQPVVGELLLCESAG